MNEFLELIKEGFRLAANLSLMAFDAVKSAVLGYFNQVKKWSIRFAIAATAPLVIIVPCLIFKLSLGGLYGAYVVWIVLLVAAELLLLTPMFLVWRRLKAFFPNVASELQEWLDFIRTVIFNGLSLGIFVTLFPIWRAPGAFPLLLLVLACWVTLPACGFSSFCKRIYPGVRAIQLLVLFSLLVMQMAFPQHMKQLGWASSRKIGDVLTDSVGQREITSEWKNVQWFNNTGEPQVWYSGSEAEGFHLWATPGFDRKSGQELKSVDDQKIRDLILANLTERARRMNVQQALRDEEQRRKNEAERVRRLADDAKHRAEQEEQARQTAAIQKRDYIARYRRIESLHGAGSGRSAALFILGDKGQKNEALGVVLAGSLRQPEFNVSPDFFKPAFGPDGVAEQLLAGSRDTGAKLDLANSLDVLLLGRISASYTTNDALQNLITAELKLELIALSASSLEKLHAAEWKVQGASFKPDDARVAAEDRLQKSLPVASLDAFRKTVTSMLR